MWETTWHSISINATLNGGKGGQLTHVENGGHILLNKCIEFQQFCPGLSQMGNYTKDRYVHTIWNSNLFNQCCPSIINILRSISMSKTPEYFKNS